MANARLLYVMDPMCSWCWGFAPVAQALIEQADAAGVPLALVMGGLRTGHGASAQATVDVDIAIGDHFGTVGDRTGDDQIAVAGVDLLAGAHRAVVVLRAQRVARFGRRQDRLRPRHGFGRTGLGGRRGRGRLIGGAELGDQRQAHAAGQSLGFAGAVGQPHRQHAGAAHRFEQRVDRAVIRQVQQVAEVQHHGGAGEHLRRGAHAALKLLAQRGRIDPAHAHAGDAYLAEAQVAGVG